MQSNAVLFGECFLAASSLNDFSFALIPAIFTPVVNFTTE